MTILEVFFILKNLAYYYKDQWVLFTDFSRMMNCCKAFPILLADYTLQELCTLTANF